MLVAEKEIQEWSNNPFIHKNNCQKYMKEAKQRGTRGWWESEIHKASLQKGKLPSLLHQNRQSLLSTRVVSALGAALGCESDLPFSVAGRFSRQHHIDRETEKAEGDRQTINMVSWLWERQQCYPVGVYCLVIRGPNGKHQVWQEEFYYRLSRRKWMGLWGERIWQIVIKYFF